MPASRTRRSASRAVGEPSLPTPVHSSHTTPLSSAYPSTYASEAENDAGDEVSMIPIHALTLSDSAAARLEGPGPTKQQAARKPFRFLDLPSELRIDIYALHFEDCGPVIDLDSDNHKRIHKKLAILRTCRTIYHEASHVFYSTHTFRVFPTQPGRFFKTKKPLLARLNARQRRSLTSLELRLGPGWNAPPRGWVVNQALGLAECVNVRKLTVFVEFDPSHGYFKGFRKADGFYETFSRNLLDDVLGEMPFLDRVHFDAWSSVKKAGALMQGLFEVARARGRKICWGPERNWTDSDDADAPPHAESAIVSLGSSEQHLVY
ncbi:5fe40ad4-503f-4e39-8a3e-4949c9dc86c9 [Thermothielavioides terrestris]|uniref:DUF7730 domain-containing protein n=2 Tax=Thermothielavioides terrestris TaxID=2587410 RepID=G2RCK4_THETT|nr:uncharacterized protein THITE_2080974 [Thermothielavioides terrestris NRRL 8126]AEO69795.1 hypothetical protein THITE_2080974 [Thermothielavioides terrestris NRRL 8126]SPQ17592.1 5fe40ad4-503f-4e39-8a3e-4949c9dc86c9 [Thermothielavioides terrestris]